MIFAEDLNTYFAVETRLPEREPCEVALRQAARAMAFCILQNTPTSAEQAHAVMRVREALAMAQMALRFHADQLPQAARGAA